MDVRLPDGTIVRGVPDGMSRADLTAKLARNGYDVSKLAPTTAAQDVMQHGKNALGGLIRGAGSIGATVARPFESAAENDDRRKRIDENMADLVGADPESWMYKGFKLGGEIAGTAGAGGVVANGLRAVPLIAKGAAPVLNAISSSGMTAGGLSGAKAVGARALGGAVSGGAQAAMVDPGDSGTGAVIGAFTPGALQLAGKFGKSVYAAVAGSKPDAGRLLAEAMGVSEAELPAIIKALNAAPDSIVPGSKLTVNQVLQLQGANQPGVKMLERIVSGGAGGDDLLKRYAQQAAARTAALEANGAVMDEPVRELATRMGDRIGSVLRTQAGDDKAAARAAWESVYGRAASDGVRLQLPLDDMAAAMSPLGRGSVVTGADARRVLGVANDIGTETLDAIKPLSKSAGTAQTLEQAVRAQGGIRADNALTGELSDLRIRGSGTTGLVTKNGKPADLLAQVMHERGFIPDADPATLFHALRNRGGRSIFGNDAPESAYQRAMESAMGDMPDAEIIKKAVPFDEFQRLRRDSGSLAAKASERAGSETEAGVLAKFQELLAKRADDAAGGNTLSGDSVTPEFLRQYNAARGMTKTNADLYKGGNNIASILRKPAGQDFTLTGDEITNKLWHGGAGLGGDVANLKRVLSDSNSGPTMDALRKYIMTDAASRTTAAGDLAAGLPRYVEQRMPGLLEALSDDQLRAITGVSKDIQNAAAASNVKGLLGSDTQAKISRALDGGLLDSAPAKALGKFASIKGIGLDSLRGKAAESVVKYKGKTLSALLASPKDAAKALQDVGFVQSLDAPQLKSLRALVSRSAPLLATD